MPQIELAQRLPLDSPTIPATDLLLTKLQVELTEKDASDLAELLSYHALGSGPGDHVDVPYLEGLVADDWGLWRTITGTLVRLPELQPGVAESSRRSARCSMTRAERPQVPAAGQAGRAQALVRAPRWVEVE